MHFNWLHFTDLHCGMREDRWLWDTVLDRLRKDLAILQPRCGPWDLILFTGDLTDRGTRAQFDELDARLTRLADCVAAGQDGRQPILLAVPGNHDLQRPPSDDEGLSVLAAWRAQPPLPPLFWDKPDAVARKTIDTAFAEYRAWWERRVAPQLGRNGLVDLRLGTLPGDFSATLERDGCRLGLLGLNTAALQLTAEDYEHRLALHSLQFNAACGGSGLDWAERHHACLLMSHHPPAWLETESRGHLEGQITDDGRFAVHLCGHLHEPYRLRSAVNANPEKFLFQGRSLFGLEHFGGRQERLHGYTAGRIHLGGDQARTLVLWPRRGELSGGELRINADSNDLPVEATDTGPIPFKLVRPCSGAADAVLRPPAKPAVPAPAAVALPAVPAAGDAPRPSGSAAAATGRGQSPHPQPRQEEPMPQHSVYVSYAWKPPSQEIVDRLQAACAARGIALQRDANAIKYGESIRDYMRRLGRGGAVVVVLSADYLRSENCMFELLEIEKNKDFHQRVYPILVRGTPFFKQLDRLKYTRYWEQEAAALENEIKGMGQQDHLSAAHAALNHYRDIRRSIDGLSDILADMNALTEDVHVATDFAALLDRLTASMGTLILPETAALPTVADRFDPEFARRIEEALQLPDSAPLRHCLAARLGAATEVGLGEVLCRKDAMKALLDFRGAAHTCRLGMAAATWAGPLQTAARGILGWLLARLVQKERPADPFAFEVRVGTEVGAEVLWLRWVGGDAPPEFKVEGGRLIGKGNVLGGAPAAEPGWEGPPLHQVQVAVWKRVRPWETPPEQFGEEEVAALADAVAFDRGSIGAPYYATFDRGRADDPYNDPDVLERLRGIGLKIITIEAADEDLFGISEQKLRTFVSQCVGTIEGPRP
ncbi:TIR domain-containing protein [uncultured Thiodictyon sp.]|jgi:hypothetical protein|uniref:TIR domain-containing protein n=1 Tax=uncultured Thiodictyon sp. TaxID=1846217 RepID=UPI0025D0E316|nr:TIR domain-containing protein [uncultured Thiodictyon sp.]